jgi:hypothetical protein
MPMRVGLPSYPYSFLIEKRGNLIVAQDSRGRIRFSGTDASAVIQSAINALGSSSGSIFLKYADYDLGSNTLQLTFSSKQHIKIFAENGTQILGSGTKMLEVTNNAWILSFPPSLELENLRFMHTAPDDAIGLDLKYINADLRMVRIENLSATKTGKTGIRFGEPTASNNANNPGGALWERVSVIGYGVGFDIGFDHLVAESLIASKISDIAYYLHSFLKDVTLINPFLYGGGEANVKTFVFNYCGRNVIILNPKNENTVDFVYPVFNTVNYSQRPIVIEFDSSQANQILCDDSSKILILNRVGQYKTIKHGNATITAGNTYVDVTGFPTGYTVLIDDVQVTPRTNLAGRSFWINSIAGGFRINISSSDTIDHRFAYSHVPS